MSNPHPQFDLAPPLELAPFEMSVNENQTIDVNGQGNHHLTQNTNTFRPPTPEYPRPRDSSEHMTASSTHTHVDSPTRSTFTINRSSMDRPPTPEYPRPRDSTSTSETRTLHQPEPELPKVQPLQLEAPIVYITDNTPAPPAPSAPPPEPKPEPKQPELELHGRSGNAYGQGYSSAHPIPTIQGYLAEKKKQEGKRDTRSQQEKDDEETERSKMAQVEKDEAEAGENKDEVMKRMQGDQGKPTQQAKGREGEHTVKDPTTGRPVTIKDAEFDDYPPADKYSSLNPAPAHAKIHHTRIGPSPAAPTNISLQPFPPAKSPTMELIALSLRRLALFSIAASFLVWVLVAFSSGWFAFIVRTVVLGAVGYGGAFFAWGAERRLEKEMERVRLEMHRERGEKFSPPMPESVEWLNALVGTIWGLINPDMFLSTADMLEDVMQQSLPGFVDAVRISDLGQGVNPFRIVSMRGLPDRPTDKAYPREAWIHQGKPPPKTPAERAQDPSKDHAPDLDQSGDYVNMEIAFAYAAQPGQSEDLRSKNIHLLLEFFLGFFDWLHIPIPIWVQIESIVGTVRLRIQFIPEAPFIRNVTFAFMGVPAVEVSVVPMSKALPNVLDLPFISSFVKMAIAAGTAAFCAPKSMTINMQEMLSGAAIGDTRAVGVFIVTIHYGENLSAQDRGGTSDPYIVLAYAKFGKPLYSTRIILEDVNPVFEETCAVLLTQDEVKSEEALSLMLWDSDPRTSDDLIGRVKVDVKELMKNPNQMHRRADSLMGFEDANEMQGKLHWSVGFFEKAPLRKELEIPEENPSAAPAKTLPEMEMVPGDAAPAPAARDGPPPPPDPTRTPPDPRWKSGVLSVVIHQINNLEKADLKGTTGRHREGAQGQDTDDPSEQSAHLPSSYCELIINDDLVYSTRVKQYTSMPFFEAGTEKFIRDWENTVVRVVVRDSALREKDPILGIVNLPLKKLFSEASEVTRLFAMEEGIGFGRINISLLFKPFMTDLPPNLLGWETGTVEILAPVQIEIDAKHHDILEDFKNLTISTSDSTEKLAKKAAHMEGSSVATWEIEKLRLPVYSRYQSVLTFELQGKAVLGLLKDKVEAIAVLWLQELVDDEEREVRIPIIVGENLKVLRQNYLNEFTRKTHQYEIVGWLTTRVSLDAGLDADHQNHSDAQARKHAFETYDHIEGEAEVAVQQSHFKDDGVIDKHEAKEIKKAEKRQERNRHRGISQFKPYRSLQWMKEGVKNRIKPGHKGHKAEPAVQSEGRA